MLCVNVYRATGLYMLFEKSLLINTKPSSFSLLHIHIYKLYFQKSHWGSLASLTRFERRGHKKFRRVPPWLMFFGKFPKGPPLAYVFWKTFPKGPPLAYVFWKNSKKIVKGGKYWLIDRLIESRFSYI